MPTTRPLGLSEDPSTISCLRYIPVTVSLAADPPTLSDANYPVQPDSTSPPVGDIPTVDKTKGGVVWAGRWTSVFVGLVNGDGTAVGNSISVVVEPLIFDRYGATDNHWHRMLDANGNPIQVTLTNAGFRELVVNAHTVFLRVATVTGSITNDVQILGFPGEGVLS